MRPRLLEASSSTSSRAVGCDDAASVAGVPPLSRGVIGLLAALGASGCSSADLAGEGHPPPGIGDVVGGLPSQEERAMLVAINRVRAAPNDVAAGNAAACSTPHDPVPPVVYLKDLAEAARFHCNHSAMNQGGLSHASYCTLRVDLEESGCTGAASCSCVSGTECWSCDTLGGCGTGPSERAQLFGYGLGSVSEVGAAGTDGWGSVGLWTTECPGSEGHRNTLTSGGLGVVGTGFASGSACWGSYGFADFGSASVGERPRIASGALHGSRLYANYYDAAGDPQSIDVVIDGQCLPMAVELGDVGNRSYVFDVTPGAGCHAFYFAARDAVGALTRYPAVGSLTYGACDDAYLAEQADAACVAP